MHIILGLLGTIVTILILINRAQDAGIDIGWLNPFTWHRRRKFRKQYQANPAFALQSPMDAAALLMVTIAKMEGDMSREQKHFILNLFESDFKLSENQAVELLGSSSHLFGNGMEVKDNPQNVLKMSLHQFTPEQIDSVESLLEKVANNEGPATDQQKRVINKIKSEFSKKKPKTSGWQ